MSPQACDGPTALSASSSAEAVLVPQYEGPITNPYSGSHWSVPEGVILVEPYPLNRLTTVEPDTNLDSHVKPSAATALPQMHVTEAQEHAVQCFTSPPSASSESPGFGAALHRVGVPALNVSPLAMPLFADMADSPDYAAALAQALANLCRCASEERCVQSAQQAVSELHNSSQAGACSSKSADNAAEAISDDLTAMVDSLVSSEIQHAAVDQVLDGLLAEVAAPLQPVQSCMSADTNGSVSPIVIPMISFRVSLPATSVAPQRGEVDQVLDELLAEVSAPLQAVQSRSGHSEATLMVSLPADKGIAEQMLASMPPISAPDNLSMRAWNRSPPLLAQLGCQSSKPLAVAKELAGTPGQPFDMPPSLSRQKPNFWWHQAAAATRRMTQCLRQSRSARSGSRLLTRQVMVAW
ncbi:TPA: hypothetical protein ACH3X2_011611 [Trebouxia sp. C0005]